MSAEKRGAINDKWKRNACKFTEKDEYLFPYQINRNGKDVIFTIAGYRI